MLSPPQLIWRTQPNFLYTLFLLNGDIEDAVEVGGKSYQQSP
jgi:hypothetical protein